MAIPTASFNYSANGLIIQFMDSSTESPTSWAWDFGDGASTSTQKNPSWTYSAAGTYTVELTATNADGSSEPYEFLLVVSEVGSFGFTIEQMVELEIPTGITIDPDLMSLLIKKWQMTLYNSFTPPVDIEDVHDQSSYTALANLLIARLVTYDLIIKSAESFLLTGAGTSTGTATGSQKSIKTGPTEVTWYNSLEQITKIMGSNSDAFTNIVSSICGLASTQGIFLNMCKPHKGVVVWDKAGRTCPNPDTTLALLVPNWFYIGTPNTLANEC